jgi:hypothetical protein
MTIKNNTKAQQLSHCVSFVGKAKAPQPSTQAFPTKGNSNKNANKKEHNVDKKEVLQAYVA